MSGAPEPDRGAIAFAEKLLTVLGEGRFTATYKYAVLLGLMDLCLEHSSRTGAAPASVTVGQLAAKVVELYWSHTAPFGQPTGRVLSQNSTGQAEILSSIQAFRDRHAPDPSATLGRARLHAPAQYARLLHQIEWKLVQMPLPRLQTVGNEEDAFLYRIGWNDRVSRREFANPGFDRTIRFIGAAGDHLVRLSGLLRPLVQREWSRLVGRFNPDLVPESGLEEFLFGTDRSPTGPIRDDLRTLDEDRCFYCGRRLRDDWEVDHFVPWARYPDNGIENLVSADRGCNGAKCDHLAAADHVEGWLARSEKRKDDLLAIAERRSWDRHPERSVAVARSIYLRLPGDARLWRLGREFVKVERRRLVEAFTRSAPV